MYYACNNENNFLRVTWNGVMLEYILAVNGVKHDGILSSSIFLYMLLSCWLACSFLVFVVVLACSLWEYLHMLMT